MNHVPLKKKKRKHMVLAFLFFLTYIENINFDIFSFKKNFISTHLGKELKTMKYDIPQEISFLGLTKITDANMREHFFL